MPDVTVEFLDDPAAFLAATADHLAADPVVTTVIASVSQWILAADTRGLPRGEHPRWWVVVRDGAGKVVGAAMRTAPCVCLFTDQANPTSNRMYEAIGYRPVADMVNLLIG